MLAELRLTIAPPAGAAIPSVTVAVEFTPPTTDAGESVTPLRIGVTVRVVVFAELPRVAVMVASLSAVTEAIVVIVNAAMVAPARTVTLAGCGCDGSVRRFEGHDSDAGGSGFVGVTVAFELRVPTTEVGDRLERAYS